MHAGLVQQVARSLLLVLGFSLGGYDICHGLWMRNASEVWKDSVFIDSGNAVSDESTGSGSRNIASGIRETAPCNRSCSPESLLQHLLEDGYWVADPVLLPAVEQSISYYLRPQPGSFSIQLPACAEVQTLASIDLSLPLSQAPPVS